MIYSAALFSARAGGDGRPHGSDDPVERNADSKGFLVRMTGAAVIGANAAVLAWALLPAHRSLAAAFAALASALVVLLAPVASARQRRGPPVLPDREGRGSVRAVVAVPTSAGLRGEDLDPAMQWALALEDGRTALTAFLMVRARQRAALLRG